MAHLIIFDVETGGVLPQHPTIQLAAVAVDEASGAELASFETKIAFDEGTADPEALRINHYDPAAWQGAPSPSQVAERFARFIKPYSTLRMVSQRTGRPYSVAKLGGFNVVAFDMPRLRDLFGSGFFPCSFMARDVLQRALFYFDERPGLPQPENFKLSTLCRYFGIDAGGAHDALADVRMTAALNQKLRGAHVGSI